MTAHYDYFRPQKKVYSANSYPSSLKPMFYKPQSFLVFFIPVNEDLCLIHGIYILLILIL